MSNILDKEELSKVKSALKAISEVEVKYPGLRDVIRGSLDHASPDQMFEVLLSAKGSVTYAAGVYRGEGNEMGVILGPSTDLASVINDSVAESRSVEYQDSEIVIVSMTEVLVSDAPQMDEMMSVQDGKVTVL